MQVSTILREFIVNCKRHGQMFAIHAALGTALKQSRTEGCTGLRMTGTPRISPESRS